MLLSGSCRERLPNQSCLREPLTVVFQPAGSAQSEEFGAGTLVFTIELGGTWQDRAYRLQAPVADLHGGDLLWLALHTYREYTRLPDPGAPLAIEGLVMQMLADGARKGARARNGVPPLWLQRVLSRLHAGHGGEEGLKDLALVAHVHPVHLSRGFRRFTGFTFGEYLQRLRVQCACRHMLNPILTLGEIANLAGFADQSHLTNVVRTITGFTPAVLRDLLPADPEGTEQLRPSEQVFHPVQDTAHPTSPMFALGSG